MRSRSLFFCANISSRGKREIRSLNTKRIVGNLRSWNCAVCSACARSLYRLHCALTNPTCFHPWHGHVRARRRDRGSRNVLLPRRHRLFRERQDPTRRVFSFQSLLPSALHSERVGEGFKAYQEKALVLHVNVARTFDCATESLGPRPKPSK